MKTLSVYFLGLVLSFTMIINTNAQDVELNSEIDSVSYCLGASFGSNVKDGGFDTLNIDVFAAAVNNMIKGEESAFDQQEISQVLQAYMQKLQDKEAKVNLEESETFLAENIKKEGIDTLKGGLQYKVLKDGNGKMPKATDTVKVHYHGTLIDGTVFDSSYERGQPAEFPLNRVISGWTEALQHMKEGAKWKLYIPPHMGYGTNPPPRGPIGPNTLLIFDVELISVK